MTRKQGDGLCLTETRGGNDLLGQASKTVQENPAAIDNRTKWQQQEADTLARIALRSQLSAPSVLQHTHTRRVPGACCNLSILVYLVV